MAFEYIPELATALKQMLPYMALTQRSKKLILGGSTPIKGFPIQACIEKLKDDDRDIIMKKFGAHFSDFYNHAANDLFMVEICKFFVSKIDTSTLKFNDSIRSPISKLKIILNVYDLKRSFMFDAENDQAYPYDYDYICQQIETILGDAKDHWMAENSEHCRLSYTPNKKERIFRDPTDDHVIFNYWQEPEWSRGWAPNPDATCPEILDQYLKHLVMDDQSLHYLKCWIRDCIFNRADPILILHGTAGTGKTFFISSFLGAFFRPEDYHMSPSINFGEDKFQSELADCRLIHGEEVNVNDNGREYLKMLHNGKIAIKRKFKDVGAPEKIWGSIVLTMNPKNNSKKIRLEYSDRKFFVPNLNPKPLKDTWGLDKVNELAECLKDHEFIRQCASYFYHNFKEDEAKDFPKTQQFKDMCINSYDFYFRRFIALCQIYPEINHRDFKKNFHKFTDPSDLENMIKHYEDNFGEKLCIFENTEYGGWHVKSLIYGRSDIPTDSVKVLPRDLEGATSNAVPSKRRMKNPSPNGAKPISYE